MDVEDIAPGQRFAETIHYTIARCETVLVVIGPRWAEILHQREQEQEPDYLCQEIKAALERKITIVPVLVGGASMAELGGLPGELSALTQYEAAELRDSTFREDCDRLAKALRLQPAATTTSTRSKVLWAAPLIAILAISAWMAIGPGSEYRARKASIRQMLATARTQAERGEYESAFRTYQGLLKLDPSNGVASDLQVDAAMGWVEDFHVLAPEGAKPESLAATRLDEIMPVLDAGLARTDRRKPRAADILAHLGWAHWLNQHLAFREFGPAAARDLREALRIDPSNAVAHAMLGNWLMQTGGRTEEALQHFQVADAAGKAKPFIRQLQLGVLVYPREPEIRKALIRLADEMRRNGEAVDDRQRRQILTAFNPGVNSAAALSQTLSAVPPDDAWATYIWLDDGEQHRSRDFIHASLLELKGKRQEALAAFYKLRVELQRRGDRGRFADNVDTALQRLSKP